MLTNHKQHGYCALSLLASLIASSCSKPATLPTSGSAVKQNVKPRVFVVNYPLMYFVERIAGDTVDIDFPVPPDIDPAFWKPNAEDVLRLQTADLIVLNGANYAKWTRRVSLPETMSHDTTINLKDRYIRIEDATTHQHGPKGKQHSHTGYAFTTWLDLKIAVEQARAVNDALTQFVPNQKSTYLKNFAALEQDLLALDGQIEQAVAKIPNKPLVASHPVYQYFTKRYGLNLKSVHWEPDEMPGEDAWKDFAALIAKHPAKSMLWEGEPNKDIVAKLDNMGIESVVFDPCGNKPAMGDFLEVMRSNVERFATVFTDNDAAK